MRKSNKRFIGTLAQYLTQNYVLHCLEWCNANKSLPVDFRRHSQADLPPMIGVGIGLDSLLVEFHYSEAADVGTFSSEASLVQHGGIESARRVITNVKQNRFPRAIDFPYMEGYVTLDDDAWW